MKVRDFIEVLINARCSDKLIIYDQKDKGKEVYYGYVDEKRVYKYLEDRVVDGMWIGVSEICISII